jgi:signal transduction histidine kinase
VADIRDGLSRMDAIVRGVRAFSREGGATDSVTDVNQAIRSALALAQASLQARASVEVVGSPVRAVRGHQVQIGQVFLNLLVNAAQALPEQRPGNAVRVEVKERDDGHVEVAIEDNGHGIAPADLPRIFDPFFTTKPAGEGTGLGLYVSRCIVEECGGRIEVDSRPGEGTRFRILLPEASRPA